MKQFYLYILILVLLTGCDDYTEHKPFDIIKGNEDVQTEYYKKLFVEPTLIYGTVYDKKTNRPVAQAKVTLTLQNSNTAYHTVSQDDGQFKIYGDYGKNYALSFQKTGYDKAYVRFATETGSDTTFFLNGERSYSINLRPSSTIPALGLKYLSKVNSPLYNGGDLSFNETNLVALDTYYDIVYYFDANGKQLKSQDLYTSSSAIGCNGAQTFYTLEYGGQMIGEVTSSSGNLADLFSTDVDQLYDVEFYDNKLWTIDNSSLYKMSLSGVTEGSLNMNEIEEGLIVTGVTQKDGLIYILAYYDTDNILFKIHPTSLEVLGRGIFPSELAGKTLKGIAFDNTNLWVIDSSTKALLKISVTD